MRLWDHWDPYLRNMIKLTHGLLILDDGLMYVHHITPNLPIILLTKVKTVLRGAPLGPMYFSKQNEFGEHQLSRGQKVQFHGS